jgi:uncharacterized lipoprotein NlpE involved in copper resistance
MKKLVLMIAAVATMVLTGCNEKAESATIDQANLTAAAENKEVADEFHVTISLKPGTWDAFTQATQILQDKELAKYVKNVIEDANDETGRRADVYATNGKYDLVRVVGDGVSGENETKTDINFKS